MTQLDDGYVSELARFLTTSNVFRLLKLLGEHPEGMSLDQLAEALNLKKSIVLAILHEGWERNVIEPVPSSSPAMPSNESKPIHATGENVGLDDPNIDLSSLDSPLLREIPFKTFLERQAFLLTASREINEPRRWEESEIDLTTVSPLMKTAFEQRMKSGASTLFHLSSWAQEMFSRVSTVEEMKEHLKQRGLIK